MGGEVNGLIYLHEKAGLALAQAEEEVIALRERVAELEAALSAATEPPAAE
jgi:BMFP domain-containing protein YqiC